MLVRTSLSLNALVDLGMYSDYVDSPFVFWAAHDDHAFLLVLAVFVVGMTVFAMASTLRRSRTRPCTLLPQGGRSGDFAQPGKSARLVVPRVADREDVRRSGTMDGSL